MNALSQFLLIVAGATVAIVVVALVISRLMRWAKTRPPALSSLGWTLLFFTSGRMPPPPPQTHIEQETREKKNREIGRDHGDP